MLGPNQTPSPSLTRDEARATFAALGAVERVRGLLCTIELDVSEDEPDTDEVVITWACEILHNGDWYQATLPDHWPEGVEIHWSAP